MSMQDPISDLLTRLRNAQMIGIKEVELPASQMKMAILNVLQSEGYIEQVEESALLDSKTKKSVKVTLKYHQGRPVLEKIKRISTPGKRVYGSCENLPLVRGGLGIAIVSTSKGLMTDRAARAARLGGEIICTVE